MPEIGEYTYLTLPPDTASRSCIGLVVAGMAARARIGVGGLEEAVDLLEARHSKKDPTRYRFSFRDEGLLAEVEEREAIEVPKKEPVAAGSGWRTVVELVS